MQTSGNEKQLPQLAQMLELAKITEQKAKELCELATEIDEKWQLRLEGRLAAKQKAHQE
jgi:hypothetical protein